MGGGGSDGKGTLTSSDLRETGRDAETVRERCKVQAERHKGAETQGGGQGYA